MRVALVAGMLMMSALSQAVTADDETSIWSQNDERRRNQRLSKGLGLYENDANSAIQSFSIVGRYHGQYWWADAEGEHGGDWENRRFYIGAEAFLFRQLTVHAQIKVSEDFDPFYEGLYQAYVRWSPDEEFALSVGRVDFLFTGLERSVSSTRIVTFERGLLVNQVMPQEVVGALVEGKPGDFSYRGGLFAGSIAQEFTDFEGGFGAVAGVGHAAPLFYETGRLHLDYVYNNGNPANNAFEPYDHILSLWHQGQSGPLGLGVDVSWGHGLDDLPDVMGLTVLPTYVLAKDLAREGDAVQAVFRYQLAFSDADNGLQLQPRYEQETVPDGFGDRYQAFYGGVNYLIFGDRLKMMAGAEYSVMHDSAQDGGEFRGWTYLVGVRACF